MLNRIVWLTLGMFAIGTEGFMIAGLLPNMAADLDVSITSAGQLVTVFALVYALGSPILATLTAGVERKRLLFASMAAFLMANLVAASATNYPMLMAARVLLALAAGQFSPAASGFAGTMATPELRGRALAIVIGGASAAVALGAPLGVWIGSLLGWRATFLGVAGISALALLGIALRLPRQAPLAAASLAQRMRIAFSPGVSRALSVTLLWSMGGFTIYTYIAVFLRSVVGADPAMVSLALFIYGVGAVTGTFAGGFIVDRFGAKRLIVAVLLLLAVIAPEFSLIAHAAGPGLGYLLILGTLAVWGMFGWSFFPAQQSRLIAMAPGVAPIVLSLNQSALYLGMAAGAVAGSFAIRIGSVANVGWAGAVCEAAALSVLLLGLRRRTRDSNASAPAEAAA